jgi:ribose transport system permease protein
VKVCVRDASPANWPPLLPVFGNPWREFNMTALIRRYGTLCAVALVMVYFWLELPSTFLTGRNLLNISQQMSMLAVVAATMTVVMAMGDFDLSVGSMASLSGIVAALIFISGGSVPVAVAAALLCGLAGGVANGVLVAYVGILPFIATLGAMTIFSGLAFKLSGGQTLFGDAIPHGFSDFSRAGIPLFSTGLLIPSLTLIAVASIAAVWVLLEQTVVGRRLYAIGDNAEAARLAGVTVGPLRLAAFGIAGLGAAGAGLMYASRVASANPTQGSGLMLDAIAAVFLGQSMTEEGEPRVLATVAGVLILGVIGNGLTQMNVDSYVRDVLTGSIVIAAVAVSSYGKARAR